jgi:hypothetical protein
MDSNEEKYTFSQQTINDYGKKSGSYSKDDLTIFRHNFTKHNETTTFESKEPSQFLYMDVGRWGGDKDTGDAWTKKRNFGLVCGFGAVLCNYTDPNTCGDPKTENISQDIKDNKDIQKMIPLLKKLSECKSLGPVTVLKALVCIDEKTEEPSSSEIFVFLGDIHAPIMNIPDRTYLQNPLKDKSCAFLRERLNPKILEKKMNEHFNDFTKLSNEITALEAEADAPKLKNLQILKQFLEELLGSQQINVWDDETFPGTDAKEWFMHYHEADIFQMDAGPDLASFLKLLLDYQKLNISSQLQLIQLGDLYDFWIGLKWVFNDALQPSNVILQQSGTDFPVQKFLDFWRNETLHETLTSSEICSLFTQTKPLNPVFVYGNHDNCRATDAWKHEISPRSFTTAEIWAEHGHQSDAFNQDSYAIIGWTCAQLGFFVPRTRNLEDLIRRVESLVTKTLCQRLIHIRHAAYLCQQENKRIYIMGHTHEPLLKKVIIVEQ